METSATERSPPHVRIAGGTLTIRLLSDTAQLAPAQRALREFLEAAGIGGRALYNTELVFEELVTNVIRHGQRDRSAGSHPLIDVGASVRDDEIVLTVEDDGPFFDPSQSVPAPLPTRIEDAQIGGLGLRLVRMAARRIDYQRLDNRNRSTVGISRT
jgi:anti-sigma regulatory factor (Ser/Thr protein kinase)